MVERKRILFQGTYMIFYEIHISIFISKVNWNTVPLIYILSTTVFTLSGQIWVVATKTLWSTECKIFIIWVFTGKRSLTTTTAYWWGMRWNHFERFVTEDVFILLLNLTYSLANYVFLGWKSHFLKFLLRWVMKVLSTVF